MPYREHWENVYTSKPADAVSWFQQRASTSLAFIKRAAVATNAHIIDIGGGASTLVDDLLASGYSSISVLDLSEAALQVTQARLGSLASSVIWLTGDITRIRLPENCYDLWHDRAVFHFMVSEEDRAAYKNTLMRSVKNGGHVILATFAEDGPLKCSGLPVQRYSVAGLQAELGEHFTLLHAQREQHLTPAGKVQNFNYCHFLKTA